MAPDIEFVGDPGVPNLAVLGYTKCPKKGVPDTKELCANYSEIAVFCHKNSEPVFITENGQGDLAVMRH